MTRRTCESARKAPACAIVTTSDLTTELIDATEGQVA
jgi:hypothetical protein